MRRFVRKLASHSGPSPALSERELEVFTQIIVSHAYRERLAVQQYRDAISLAPTQEDREYVRRAIQQEMDHYQGCLFVAQKYRIPLEDLVRSRMQRRNKPVGIPAIHTWEDFLLAQTFNDEAGYFVLQGFGKSKIGPYAELAKMIIADEQRHGEFGERRVAAALRSSRLTPIQKKRLVEKHLRAGIRCLGRPNTPGTIFAESVRIKSRHQTSTLAAYNRYASKVLIQLGLPGLKVLLPARKPTRSASRRR